jgi:CheY-like chemotaxis protein
VLVVDDELDLREILSWELAYRGAQVVEVPDGARALAATRCERFDAIVSDIRMPGGDGVRLLRDLRGRGDATAIFFLTGFADHSIPEVYDSGAEGIFQKPFDVDRVISRVSRWLKPPADRWRPGKKGIAPSGVQLVATPEELKIGRGGFFVPIDRARPLVAGAAVTFRIGGSIEGMGRVRWSRAVESAGLPAGVGVEIEELAPGSVDAYLALIERAGRPIAFIPRG